METFTNVMQSLNQLYLKEKLTNTDYELIEKIRIYIIEHFSSYDEVVNLLTLLDQVIISHMTNQAASSLFYIDEFRRLAYESLSQKLNTENEDD